MILKPGVKISGVRPETVFAISVAGRIWDRHGKELVITSVKDGKHKTGSKHYSGDAFDGRTRYFDVPEQEEIKAELINALGPDFDVVLHKTHMHVEFHPKNT